jgi:hypothetical protein
MSKSRSNFQIGSWNRALDNIREWYIRIGKIIMTKVFISYSHKDNNYAHELALELTRWGFDVWIDDRIDFGTSWTHEIEQNLADCDAFILVMTDNAWHSTWVQNELAFAQTRHKQIFPLLLEGDTWLPVISIQHVDVRSGSLPPEAFFVKLRGQKPVMPDLVGMVGNDQKASTEVTEDLSLKNFRNMQENSLKMLQIQNDIFRIQKEVEENKGKVSDKLFARWQEYIHGEDDAPATPSSSPNAKQDEKEQPKK